MLFAVFSVFLICLLAVYFLCGKPIHLWSKHDMVQSFPCSRRLGFLEKIFANQSKCLVCCALHINSEKQLTEDIIRKALLALSEKQPLLHMILRREGPLFSHMKESNDLKLDFEMCMTSDWKEVMEDELKQAFDRESGPLWRVRVLPKAAPFGEPHRNSSFNMCCIFTIDHTIADGTSISHLFKDFIYFLNDILSDNIIPPQQMPLLPPLDCYIDYVNSKSIKETMKWNLRVSLSSVIMVIILIRSLIVKLAGKQPVAENPEKVQTNPIEHKDELIPIELNRKESSNLLSACKGHNTTVNSFVQAAACMAYACLSNPNKKSTEINIATPVNIRPYLSSCFPSDYLGLYATTLNQTLTVDQSSFWSMAAKLKEKLHTKLNLRELINTMLLNPVLSNAHFSKLFFWTYKIPQLHIAFSNLGNLGHLNGNRFGHVKPNTYYQSASVDSYQVFQVNLATINGKLVFLFQYNSSLINDEKAKLFAKLTMVRIRKAINGED